jgi:hypothetical protein
MGGGGARCKPTILKIHNQQLTITVHLYFKLIQPMEEA